MGVPLSSDYFLRSCKIMGSFLLSLMYVHIFKSKLYLYVLLLLGINDAGEEPVVEEQPNFFRKFCVF